MLAPGYAARSVGLDCSRLQSESDTALLKLLQRSAEKLGVIWGKSLADCVSVGLLKLQRLCRGRFDLPRVQRLHTEPAHAAL